MIHHNVQSFRLKRISHYAIFALTILLIFSVGCHIVSFYDSISYKNLTDLKGEMKVVFEKFSMNGAKGDKDSTTFAQLKLEISKGLEYESGKAKNDNTIEQWKIINSLFDEVIQRFQKDGKNELSAGYCEAKWKIFETAFDIAISTENNKLKN